MPVTFTQNGHTFDVIISSKGMCVEYGGQEVFRFWPGDEYAAHLPSNQNFDASDLAGLISASGVQLAPGQYKVTIEGSGSASYVHDVP